MAEAVGVVEDEARGLLREAVELDPNYEPARRVLGQRVRVGRPLRVAGLPQNVTGPAFSALVGLAVYSVRPHDEFWDFEAPSGLSGGTRMRRAVRWFRDNW